MIIQRSDDEWLALIDQLKASHGLETLADVAHKLGVSSSMMCHMVYKRRKMPSACKINLLDALGYNIDRAELAGMLPANAQKALARSDRAQSEEGFMEAWGD